MSERGLLYEIENNNLDEAKRLINSGLSIDFTEECGWLHSVKSVEMRDFLRNLDPEAYSVWEKGQCLIKACAIGDLDEAKRLVSSGVSVKCTDKFERTPFHLAESDAIRDFLREVDPSAYNVWEREQSLIESCRTFDLDEAKRLVSSGVTVTCRNRYGRTPMHIVVSECDCCEVVEWLFSSGASVNERDQWGITPLNLAVLCGYEKVADRDQIGRTSMHIAVSNNNLNIVKILIEKGWDLNQQEVRRNLDYARERNCVEIAGLLRQQLKWLSRRGFLMFLATQSYLPHTPPPLADSMSRDELIVYYQQFYNLKTPHNAVHSVFFMQELQRYIMSFIGVD